MRLKFFLLVGVTSCLCINIAGEPASMRNETLVPVPTGFTKLKEADGDLDKDHIPEHIVVYDTPRKTDLGTERQIYIYKRKDAGWKLWHKSIGAVLSSLHGGSIGDPFNSIEVQRGCVVIYHFGGTTSKWTYKHSYRYQHNKWYLIGATINETNPFCHYDYNLITGRINADVCLNWNADGHTGDEDSFNCYSKSFNYKPSRPILMDGFEPGEYEIKIPGKEDTIYF